MRGLTASGVAIALAAMISPADACESLQPGPRGVVTEVTDGDTVVLDNGIVVRMIGTQAPKLPLGREGFEAWPLAGEAKHHLEEMVLGQAVTLRYGGERVDRYDRALAHLFVVDESGQPKLWAQQQMVANGMARVYSFPDNRQCLDELLAAERQARTDRLGIWQNQYYALRSAEQPERLSDLAGRYELVEGRVLKADRAGSRIYLNFGRNWDLDFTVVMERAAIAMFEEAGLDPLALEGALVRVRGWVDDWDGPRIEVTHPEQIEVLSTR
ncbi:hypothetical protein GCM10007989_22940 [Devosia pacifica]|uniref:TNase-like domain-containing protein n=1 Tax=Devosia pacifica TaxID=1335967 RepID=A0A918VUX9_9HYPH|nr:thermonuclease family protein [Devosia pacifica]GHA26559.1 hypothetical protein GCM10007989_22940 [Devosia pacifica]